MKAFVINEDQIIKAGLVVVAVMILMFVSGYFVGSNCMSSNVDVKTETVATIKDKSETLKTENNNLLSKAEKKTEKKKQTKTDKPKKVDNKKIKEQNKKTEKKKKKKKENTKSEKKVQDKKNPDKKKTEKKTVEKKESKNKKELKAKDKSSEKTIETKSPKDKGLVNTDKSPLSNKSLSNKLGDKYYSIQAGMFSGEVNADTFIKKLSAKGFDAYVVSFESTSGNTKYNVRVGKFESREAASELLDKFQKSFSSPAYVVITQ